MKHGQIVRPCADDFDELGVLGSAGGGGAEVHALVGPLGVVQEGIYAGGTSADGDLQERGEEGGLVLVEVPVEHVRVVVVEEDVEGDQPAGDGRREGEGGDGGHGVVVEG